MAETPVLEPTLIDGIVEWLADEALDETAPDLLFDTCCRRMRALGLPLSRGYIAFRVLHPLHAARSLTWTGQEVIREDFEADALQSPVWLGSPLYHLTRYNLPLFRRRLTGDAALLDYAILRDLRDLGGCDYVACMSTFGPRSQNGLLSSWVADRPSGFTDAEIAAIQRISRHLAIAFKSKIEQGIARNVAAAYLGRTAGEAVLTGQIRRGDGRKLDAVLWYADLRRSTTLAERLPAEAFLQLLNGYFETTAGALSDAGGEIVALVGDAVLGIFPAEASPEAACAAALAAAREARSRLRGLAPGPDGEALDFGVALHRGSVIHGNIGIADRLQFTVVGSAVNEVVRVQELTKELRTPVLATAAFALALPAAERAAWRSLGRYPLRGLGTPAEILAPAP